MATYVFRAVDRKAKIVEGSVEAPSVLLARHKLRELYPSVLSLEEREVEGAAAPVVRRVSTETLSVCIRQLATMMASGIPLGRCLLAIARGDNPAMDQVFTRLSLQVQSGQSLARAMKDHPHAFNEVFVRLVHAGEVSGRLDTVLAKLADLLEKSVKLRKKVIASFTYPFILGATSAATLGLFVFYVLPLMQPIFHTLGVELPLATRIVLMFASIVRNPWIMGPGLVMVVAGGTGLYVAWRQLYQSDHFRYNVHLWTLRAPVVGPLVEKATVSRVLFTMATLLESGVSMGPALVVVEKVAGNEVFARRLHRARQAMIAGGGVHDSLEVAEVFPGMVLQMIKAGEESGSLDDMMRRVADMFEEEVDLALSTLATSMEPVILIGMGGVVAFVTLAAFLPTVKLLSEL